MYASANPEKNMQCLLSNHTSEGKVVNQPWLKVGGTNELTGRGLMRDSSAVSLASRCSIGGFAVVGNGALKSATVVLNISEFLKCLRLLFRYKNNDNLLYKCCIVFWAFCLAVAHLLTSQ